MKTKVRVQSEDFDISCEHSWLGERAGAVCIFTGLVRSFLPDEGTQYMHIEHYPGMLEKQLVSLADSAASRWQLLATVIIHRYGKLLPGENIVLVGVSSAHRVQAFTACQYIMDFLKTDAPLWKKEISENTQSWVQGNRYDKQAHIRWQSGKSQS